MSVEYQNTNDDMDFSDENNVPTSTKDLLLHRQQLPNTPKTGEYILVLFTNKKQRLYYVGEEVKEENESHEYFVKFLNLK